MVDRMQMWDAIVQLAKISRSMTSTSQREIKHAIERVTANGVPSIYDLQDFDPSMVVEQHTGRLISAEG